MRTHGRTTTDCCRGGCLPNTNHQIALAHERIFSQLKHKLRCTSRGAFRLALKCSIFGPARINKSLLFNPMLPHVCLGMKTNGLPLKSLA